MNTDTTLLQKVEELSARVVVLEAENRLLRQKLDQYVRHYFGGQRNEGLDKHQLELLARFAQRHHVTSGRAKDHDRYTQRSGTSGAADAG